jgi:hypothetical protein|tara:strand:+ start:1131 stop:1748 length:618 start_codon:yes stop_codon:yes gene_type:complete
MKRRTLKQRDQIKQAQKYFVKVVREFIYNDAPVLIVNKQRKVRLSKNAQKHIKLLGQNEKQWLMNVFDDKLDYVVQDWIKTRASYRESEKFPSGNMKNFIAHQKVGVVYLYLIDQKEAYLDIIPHGTRAAFVYWAKLAQRFIDCSHYPNVKHYFEPETSEDCNDKDNYNLVDDLKDAIGDTPSQGFPDRVVYPNDIVAIRASVDS